MTALTPLSSLPGFTAHLLQELGRYWVTSLEEFVGVAEAPNQTHGSGLGALRQNPVLPVGKLPGLLEAAKAALAEPPVCEPRQVALGVLLDSSFQAGPAQPVKVAAGLPGEFLLPAPHLPEPRDQGARAAGLAFALAAMLQQLSGAADELSAQFLAWAGALYRERDGDELGPALRALGELGVCRACTWPYDPQTPGRVPPPGAVEEARQWRAGGPTWLKPDDLPGLKTVLHSGQPVLLVLPVHQHWCDSWPALRLGRVRAPLRGEAMLGQQALLALGYRNDPAAPGGGYLIARNSWGPAWGAANPDGPGHAHIPYQLVQKDCKAALTLAPAQTAAAASGGLPEQARVLIEEAQTLLTAALPQMARLQELIQQLQGQPVLGAGVPPAPAAPSAPAPEPAGQTRGYGPLILRTGAQPDESAPLAANGIMVRTGQPLLDIDAGGAGRQARAERPANDPHRDLHSGRKSSDDKDMGTVRGQENNLDYAGWAVVIHAKEDAALLKALSPLIRKRCEDQARPAPALDDFRPGETCIQWLQRKGVELNAPLKKSGMPVLLYLPGEDVTRWLSRHGTSAGPVKPSMGVPFHLMLVGRPGSPTPGDQVGIPFSFQYALDLFWGVGRLCFTDPRTGAHDLAAYARYAEQVVAYEQRARPSFGKHIVYFGTEHPTDLSTKLSSTELVQPLAGLRDGSEALIAQEDGFTQEVFLGKQATRDQLRRALKGETAHGRPALLFTATHGVGLPPDDPSLAAHQGALLCQDWPGEGTAQREHWFAAEDLPEQGSLEGLMAFCFACYGVGSPQKDDFAFASDQPRDVAPYPLVAQLPQHMLDRGALLVLGHVDRAWSHSFRQDGKNAQTQRFESVLLRLMQGDRAGLATDQFNMMQGKLSVELADLLVKVKTGLRVSDSELGSLWAARNDARNYALLGDPAVRLPFGKED